jgi:hypothetical protein
MTQKAVFYLILPVLFSFCLPSSLFPSSSAILFLLPFFNLLHPLPPLHLLFLLFSSFTSLSFHFFLFSTTFISSFLFLFFFSFPFPSIFIPPYFLLCIPVYSYIILFFIYSSIFSFYSSSRPPPSVSSSSPLLFLPILKYSSPCNCGIHGLKGL